MALVPFRSSLLEEIRELQQEMDRIMQSAFGPSLVRPTAVGWTPPVDITETPDAIVLRADIPGVPPEDIDIELENNVLTIRGERKEEREEKGERYHLFERRYGSFVRSFTLPRTVDANRIKARFENGVLTITMPKTEEAKGRRIEVEAGGRGSQGREVPVK